jgi:ADP-ribose pyrophosphatase YjhB (NUDIX family)
MSLEVKIHEAQTAILRELLFRPSAGFAELQKSTKFTSDHFSFHVTRLVELNLVEKIENGKYALSSRGKEYANKLDTDSNTIERQPKTAVILALERTHKGEKQFLFQERLKNPYFGYWGLPSGKIRWGETITETAARESLEETNLEADFRIAGIYHELVTLDDSDEMTEDKIFFVCHGTNVKGDLLVDFEGGHNEWMTFDQALKKKLRFESFETELEILNSEKWFFEQIVKVPKKKF